MGGVCITRQPAAVVYMVLQSNAKLNRRKGGPHLWRAPVAVLVVAVWLLWPASGMGAPAAQGRGYVVQAGDSLSEIAERARVPVEELMALNGIEDADAIVVGQLLLLPARNRMPAQATDAETPSEATTVAEPAGVNEPPPVEVDMRYVGDATTDVHVVAAGESLSEIAKRYSMDMGELMRLNGIADANQVFSGQRLRLTHAVSTGTAQPAQTPEEELDTRPQAELRLTTSLNRTHRVELGDDLARIAVRYGVDEDALRAVNRLEDAGPQDIEVGQELILPATSLELQVERVAPAVDRTVHTVQAGDSLGLIAEAYGLTLADLMEANYISNADSIYVDQVLEIPSQTDGPVSSPVSAERIGRPRSGFYYHTVQPGDTLSELARDFNSTQLAILEYNNLPDPETVYNGLPLRIPYGPPPLPVETTPTPLGGTRFLVSLSRQQCWALDGDAVLYQWTCSTGYGKWITRTGAFAVQTMQEMAQSNAYELDMPYWLGIYDVGTYENGIHGLPISWETGQKIWEGLVGMPATFGCAMLDDEDAATLYDMAYLGMPVYIVP